MFYLVSQPGRRVEQALLTLFGCLAKNLYIIYYMGHINIVHINLELDAVGCYVYNLSHWGFMRFNVPTLGFLWVIEAVLCPECKVSIGADFSIEESKGCFTWCHNQGEG